MKATIHKMDIGGGENVYMWTLTAGPGVAVKCFDGFVSEEAARTHLRSFTRYMEDLTDASELVADAELKTEEDNK